MNLTFRRLGVSELLPRYIFAESLFVRRRVLEVGAVAATGGASAEFLVQRGARLVLACDDDLEAVAAAQKRLGSAQLRFRAAVFDDLPPGGFDLVLVADLAPWVRAPELLRQLVAQVSPTGALVGGLRNPAGLALAQLMEPDAEGAPPTYGQALDALSGHFRSVEVATQSPLLGYQLAFDRSEGLQVDGSLAGSGEAAYFVVVASQDATRPVDPTWVQLPPAPLAFTGSRLDEVATRAREWEERSRRLKENLERSRRESEGLKDELTSARQARERAEEEARRWQVQAEARERHPLQPLAQDELAARVRRLEAELRGAQERSSDAERSLGVQRAELEAVRQDQRQGMAQVLAAQESVRLERARREEIQRLLDDARAKLTAAYEELRGVREELAEVRGADGAPAQPGPDWRAVEERLAQARERELRLADQHSTALQAIESLQGTAAREKARAEALEQRLAFMEAERSRAERALEATAARLHAAEGRAAAAPALALEASAAETELAALRDTVERLSARVSVAEAQESQARALADRLESDVSRARDAASAAGAAAEGAVAKELEGLRRTAAEHAQA
ncbi:MAG TPA: methyltransferase domain-containing protein, partial [Myxococcaceae bacterium]|nr:methyltransferase domain-containing protein [Myxococcaceae bacterium]